MLSAIIFALQLLLNFFGLLFALIDGGGHVPVEAVIALLLTAVNASAIAILWIVQKAKQSTATFWLKSALVLSIPAASYSAFALLFL